MKKNKSLDFFSIVLLAIIFLSMFSVALRALTRSMIKRNICPDFLSKIVFFDREDLRSYANKKQQQVEIWKELYPFEDEESENEKNESTNQKKLSTQQTVEIKLNFTLAEKIKLKANSWIDKNFCLRNFWIDYSKRITRLLVGNISKLNSKVITLDNDKGILSDFLEKSDVSQQAMAVIELKDFLKQNGIPFLYVQAPFKISPLDELHYINDFSNQNADSFLKLLKENDVDFIDMREEILRTGKDFHDFFYKTDHHWKAETGLFACPIIARKANEMADMDIDTSVFDPKNFDFEVFKNSFFGSAGRTLTLAGAKMEDITLITPKKEFDLQTEIYSSNETIRKATGGFETFIFKEHLQTTETALEKNAYQMYMWSNTIEFIKNRSCKNDYRVLFLGDSFTNVVEPFFALSVKNFDSLDLRCFLHASFKNFIKQNKPYDICVLIHYPGSFTDESLWNFE